MKLAFFIMPLLLTACSLTTSFSGPKPTPVTNDETRAVAAAKQLWQQAYDKKEDLSKGPCLSNEVIPDWVADIAHQPRQVADDDPKNQCLAFMQGKAHHFVELDEDGNFLRAF